MTSDSATATSVTMDESILEEAGLLLKTGHATQKMEESINTMARLLICPLCDKIFKQPSTLCSCAHSFCMHCIDDFACSNWNCPVEGCNMPLSITGRHGGSYRKRNPQIAQTLESLQLICKQLNESPKNWWRSPSVLKSIEETLKERQLEKSDDDEDDDDDTSVDDALDEFRKRYRKVDRQNFGESRDFARSKKDDDDDIDSIDSDDSLWARGKRCKHDNKRDRA
ncbi:hypothetical protein IV203_017724 [Nitzschia inconspicua]|uniref:RING-type domain-containing protein n=1 Tax=Nitzschia inconspicua TaxID=303405 RepID=A0A9K3K4F8_9STRA|nr:hypothetical protein IV203_017724 [Nitzschia inconspicua]